MATLEQFIHELRERASYNDITGNSTDFEMMDSAANKIEAANKLIQDLYMNCRKGQNINQHNPYTWAECNVDLFKRLAPYMGEQTEASSEPIRSIKNVYIVKGQEAMCPDGLGRVIDFCKDSPHEFIQVETYTDDRSCKWSPHNVQLIPVKM